MLDAVSLPAGVERVRTTPELTAESVPAGLLQAHRLASAVWGCVRVLDGVVTFVLETTGESRRLVAGEHQVIEPGVAHHVEPQPGAVFLIDFYR